MVDSPSYIDNFLPHYSSYQSKLKHKQRKQVVSSQKKCADFLYCFHKKTQMLYEAAAFLSTNQNASKLTGLLFEHFH